MLNSRDLFRLTRLLARHVARIALGREAALACLRESPATREATSASAFCCPKGIA